MATLPTFLEYFAVAVMVFLLLISPLISLLIPLYLLIFTRFWWLVVLYVVWVGYDFDTPRKGGRPLKWLRRLPVWTWYSRYFPIKLIKTVDLHPKRNYIFAIHPHGIINLSSFGSLVTNGCNFDQLFPGLTIFACTLKSQFLTPIRREIIMWLGGVDVSKESIGNIIGQGKTGNVACIVVGGAAEAIHAKPGSYDLVLKDRKGFVKMALRHGASLVPVVSFGETNLYDQVPNPVGSILRTVQDKVREKFGFSPVLFYNRDCLKNGLFWWPQKWPLYTVVGEPIHVEKVEEPSSSQIDNLHQTYVQKLKILFDTNKQQFGIDDSIKMNIL